MPEFKSARFKKLISDLSRDPKLREAINKINEKSRLGQHVKALRDFLPFVAKLSRLGGKKTAALGEHLSLIVFLFEISILVKKNVFERPEVQRFFKDNWGLLQIKVTAMYVFCSNQVRDRLEKARAAHARRKGNQSTPPGDPSAGDQTA